MPISSIIIDTDETTFQNWSQAMANLARSFVVCINVVDAIPGVLIPPTLNFTGVELLNEVGRAATRPDIIDDPDRLFALFRYGTKISDNTPNFRLSAIRRLRDIHKGSVLSDEIGAGFALLFASRVLGATVFMDLPDAIRRGRIKTVAPKSKVPDYIGLFGPGQSVIVLEAKGSQTKGRCLSKQLPKGCEQVASVSLPAGQPSLRVVVGTQLNKDDVADDSLMFVGDPPERHSYNYFSDESPKEIAVREHYKRVAALIGDVPLWRRTEGPEGAGEEQAPLIERTVGGRKAIGSTFEIRSKDNRTGFFVGIDAETRNALVEGLPQEGTLPLPSLLPSTGKHQTEKELSAYSIARDGSILELWLESDSAQQLLAQ